MDPFLRTICAAKTDEPDAVRSIREDKRTYPPVRKTDRRLTAFAVYDPGAVDDDCTRPIEGPSFFERNSVLGEISRGLLRIPCERHY